MSLDALTGAACEGEICTNDFCVSGACTHPGKCFLGQECCPSGECCATACEECLDNGSLSGGAITVDPGPVCVGESITFTVSGVTDNGAIKRVDCSAKTLIPPVTPTYTWTITKPDASTVIGSGPVASVLASESGAYSVVFTAKAERDCPPSDMTIPATADVQTTATLTLEPSFISAATDWLGMPDASHSVITVTWDPPECEGTLQIVEVVGDFGYVPPGNGSLTQTSPTEWRYDAFDEPQGELCAKPVTVSIAALKDSVELNRTSIRVLPVHTWTITSHADGPGTPNQPADGDDYNNDYNYLLWKYATVLATTGGAFTGGVTFSTDFKVRCPPIVGIEGYACTSWNPFTGTYSVVFATSTFADTENQAASIIGHELVHTTEGLLDSHCGAYQWESDHRFQTAIYPCAQPYDGIVNDYLFDHMCP